MCAYLNEIFSCFRRQKRDEATYELSKSKSARVAWADDTPAGVLYRPRAQHTRHAYELLLAFMQSALGDQPRDILCGACDEVRKYKIQLNLLNMIILIHNLICYVIYLYINISQHCW